jgi:hypothetical protein
MGDVFEHTAILLNTGRVLTFGSNDNGRLGQYSNGADRLVPTDISDGNGYNKSNLDSSGCKTTFNKLEFTNNKIITNNNFSIKETLNDNITTLNKSSLDIQKLYPQSSINFKDSGGSSNLFIDQTGYVGIGTINPRSDLDVSGTIIIGNSDIPHDISGISGEIRWNGTDFEGYKGSDKGWTILTGHSTNKITLVTQEQVLAGAGGNAVFTAYASNPYTPTHADNWNIGNLHDNIVSDNWNGDSTYSTNAAIESSISYEFTTPQIVTKYRIWPRYNVSIRNIRTWELRAAIDKYTYDTSGIFHILDSQSLTGALTIAGAKSDWKIEQSQSEISSSNSNASDNLHLANVYKLSTIGAYRYYLLNITGNFGGIDYHQLQEWALYGGGFNQILYHN